MISVIIPLYNKEAIIERTLRSVLSQDYDDFEVIIVDDGSTDMSLEICKHELPRICHEFAINKEKVTIITQENGGPSKARNTGVKNAKGDWIVFLDADDEFLPGALSLFMEIANKDKDCNFIATSFWVKGKGEKQKYILSNCEGKITNPFREHCLKLLVPHTGANMYKKELVQQCPFNEQLRRYEDFETWFRMYKHAKIIASKRTTFVLNADFSEASKKRSNINEDFIGHLDFTNKSFWEQQCLFILFIEERERYSQECKDLYPSLYRRYDLLFLYKLWGCLRKSFIIKFI